MNENTEKYTQRRVKTEFVVRGSVDGPIVDSVMAAITDGTLTLEAIETQFASEVKALLLSQIPTGPDVVTVVNVTADAEVHEIEVDTPEPARIEPIQRGVPRASGIIVP